jgi:hypothetical protein
VDELEARFKEWEECRKTIDRFDKILADMRRVGFTLIPTIVTAAILLTNRANPPQDAIYNVAPDTLLTAVFITTMVLVLVLFLLDQYYWWFLLATAARAECIEETTYTLRLTRRLRQVAERFWANAIPLVTYVLFLGGTAIIAYVLGNPNFPLLALVAVILSAAMILLHIIGTKIATDIGKAAN